MELADQTRAELARRIQFELRGLHNAVDTLNQRVADQLGVHRTDLRCIDVLSREHPMTAGRLAEVSGLTTGAVTAVIDRLEAAGYAYRVPDPNDRRRVLVEPTERVAEIGRRVYGDLVKQTAGLLEGYSDYELLRIFDFIQRGRQVTLAYADDIVERIEATENSPADATSDDF